METAQDALFREEQTFRRTWVMAVVLGIAAIQWWGFLQQIVLGQPWGNKPAPDWMMWLIWVVFGLGFPAAFYRMKLVVAVFSDRVSIRFWPFANRQVALADIEQVEARAYKPVREYGGWGIKGWSRQRMAYNVSGNQGVEITLKDGNSVMLGSKQAEELADAIRGQMHR